MVLAALPAVCAAGQATGASRASAHLLPAPALEAALRPGAEIFREIDDPATGDRWLLVRDTDHPGGPGRMVLAARGLSVPDGSGSIRTPAARPTQLPVIRAGDRVIVEENTPVVEARLEAVALAPALAGSVFEVRLEIGGKVVQAVALGPDRAAFAHQIGARP
jgi:hypothetical protein